MSNKMLPKQTSFESRIPSQDQADAFNLKATLGPLDLPALQSDIAGITGGTTVNASTGTVSPWKNAENPTFTAANAITIDQSSEVNPLAAPGSPVRFSDDGATWKYAIIDSVVTQVDTLDLTLKGVAMTLANSAFFEVGSPGLVVTRQIVIPGDLTVDNDQVNAILKTKLLWTLPEAFLVYVGAFVNTAASGADILAAVARGVVGNEIVSSSLNLGQATSLVDSGTTIDDSNYRISWQEELFVKVSQIGSTTPGSDLTLYIIAILDEYKFVEFIPEVAETPPFAFQMTGSISTTSYGTGVANVINAIDFFSMAVSVGSGADRGDDIIPRGQSSCMFDSTRTFNTGGISSPVHDTISFIDTPSITGNGVDRGDLPSLIRGQVGVSGGVHGFTLGGIFGNGAETNVIYQLLLGAATGDAIDRGDINSNGALASGGFNNIIGVYSGGINSSGAVRNDIFGLNISTTVGNSVARGDLLANSGLHAGLSDPDNNMVFTCGGTFSVFGTSSGQFDTIQSQNLSLATDNGLDRDDLSVPTAGLCANSGDTIGYLSGGITNGPNMVSAIDKFTYAIVGGLTVSNRGSMLVPKNSAGGDM